MCNCIRTTIPLGPAGRRPARAYDNDDDGDDNDNDNDDDDLQEGGVLEVNGETAHTWNTNAPNDRDDDVDGDGNNHGDAGEDEDEDYDD